ncbi:MAG: DHHW family protein [Roseburia sp.]|nr:DHHW family protein [Roseburia sp.]
MNKRQNPVFFVLFIGSILFVFMIADLGKEDRLYSPAEKRVLAQKPEFSLKALWSGKYTKDYETYVTDQFVGRDKWISVKTGVDILLQKKDIQGVYLGKDGYLIEQHKESDFAKREGEKLELLQRLVEGFDAKVMLVPTADTIMTDKLPLYAEVYDQKAFLEKVRKQVGEEHFIDVYSELARHAGEEIYYRTDHHWTSLGAYYGYRAWWQATGRLPYHYKTDKMETVTEDFLGTLHSKINLPMEGEKIMIFPETVRRTPKIHYDGIKTADSYYEDSYLQGKNQYGYFLDDNHGLVEIETGYQKEASLIVIKDSYANCMAPLLAPHFGKIYLVDLRYYRGSLTALLEQYREEETEVLVLYNCIHFLQDFKY